MIFSSLQILKNTYKYTLENTNILSKSIFSLFYLTFFAKSLLLSNFFNFLAYPLRFNYIRNSLISSKKIKFLLNFFLFFSKSWFLIFFNVCVIKLQTFTHRYFFIKTSNLEFSTIPTNYFNFKFLKKIIFNGVEFNLLKSPFSVLIDGYGVSYLILKLICKRLEKFTNIMLSEKKILVLFNFLLTHIPVFFNFKNIYLYNLLLLDYTNTYKVYRHIFNLPVNGQRTWGGGKSIKLQPSLLYSYKLKKINKELNTTIPMFLAEYVNLMWYHQWYHEWTVSEKYFNRLPSYVLKKKKKYIGVNLIADRRIESFFNHPYKFKKKKHHRKKKIINKHVLTTGLSFGFTRESRENLF